MREIESTPLGSHRVRYALVRFRSLLRLVFATRHHVDSVAAALHHVGRREMGQSLQPQAGGLRLSMPVLPRLDDLVWFADSSADDAHRVF